MAAALQVLMPTGVSKRQVAVLLQVGPTRLHLPSVLSVVASVVHLQLAQATCIAGFLLLSLFMWQAV